jgi:hypothetical protein
MKSPLPAALGAFAEGDAHLFVRPPDHAAEPARMSARAEDDGEFLQGFVRGVDLKSRAAFGYVEDDAIAQRAIGRRDQFYRDIDRAAHMPPVFCAHALKPC